MKNTTLTSGELTALEIESGIICTIYSLQLIFLFVNCYLFLLKQKEYKNIHSVIFYLLAVTITTARIVNLCYMAAEDEYRTIEKEDTQVDHQMKLFRIANISGYYA